jgi:hypothetical protein
METCGACGARTAPDADWCPRCYAARSAEAAVEELPAHVRMMYPPDEPVPPQEFSRWREGTTTFGPVGRMTITAVLVLVQVFFWTVIGPSGMMFMGVSYLTITGLSIWALAHVWKRDRVG